MSLDELKTVVKELGMPQFTAGQIAKWLYQQHVSSIDEMTNISKANREKLSEQFVIGAMQHIDCQRSIDGTLKYLFPVGDGSKFVETVYIPDGDRATLCVSCQVGCKMNLSCWRWLKIRRDSLYPRWRSCHALCVLSGGL